MRTRSLALFSLLGLAACSGGGVINDTDNNNDDTGDSLDGVPNIVVSKTAIDFGEIAYGDVESVTINITNNGGATLELLGVDVPAPFLASAGAGITIASGNTTPITISYIPDDFAADSGNMVLTTNDEDEPTVSIALSGSVITDQDGDGYPSTAAGGTDCDDDDASVHPDAEDLWYDGDDSNCDGADDYDQDGDGYQALGYNDDPASGGGDCQDNNPEMYPGAVDEWYDGEDTNCDGASDWDQDGDGYDAAAYGRGSDCNDENALVNRDGTEILNGLDDDCDGEYDKDVPGWSADYAWYGSAAGDYAGYAVELVDLDGNGYAEVISGNYSYTSGRGSVAIFEGGSSPVADGSKITSADNHFQGDGGSDKLGSYLGYGGVFDSTGAVVADWDADGVVELVVGAPGASSSAGAIYMITGSDALLGSTGDAHTTITGSGSYLVGTSFTANFDMDADGYSDIHGFYSNSSSSGNNYAFLMYGGTTGSFVVSDADIRLSTGETKDEFKNRWGQSGDLNGDGYDDSVFCEQLYDGAAENSGAVFILWGEASQGYTSGASSIASVTTLAAVGGKYERMGALCTIAPDVDGDGNDELWIFGAGLGELFMVPGGSWMTSATSWKPSDYATVQFDWGSSDGDPISVKTVGDYDRDGENDVAIALASGSSKPGKAFIYSSADLAEGGEELNADKWSFGQVEGKSDYFQDEFAYSISGWGDFDGDGSWDFVAGDYGYGDSTTGAQGTGAIYLSINGL